MLWENMATFTSLGVRHEHTTTNNNNNNYYYCYYYYYYYCYWLFSFLGMLLVMKDLVT